MSSQVRVAVVVPMETNPPDNQIDDQIALFNPDGSPFGAGGASVPPLATTAYASGYSETNQDTARQGLTYANFTGAGDIGEWEVVDPGPTAYHRFVVAESGLYQIYHEVDWTSGTPADTEAAVTLKLGGTSGTSPVPGFNTVSVRSQKGEKGDLPVAKHLQVCYLPAGAFIYADPDIATADLYVDYAELTIVKVL